MTDWRSEIPAKIKKLPVNKDLYPVPWFVAWIDGVPDFRVIGPRKMQDAVQMRLCWICGEPLGGWMAFVIGPMCAINRTSSEPPSHKDCAVFAAKACPFLANPERPRRISNLPEGREDPAGIAIDRNPGVVLVWITRSYKIYPVDNGVLFEIGPMESVHWFARGRMATRSEVMESITTGLPLLKKAAEEDKRPEEALQELDNRYQNAMKLLPV